MSATARRCASSVTTRKCQRCRFRPVGAWVARSTHSSISLRGTGREKSRRLRTARVVGRTSSADRFRAILKILPLADSLLQNYLTSPCRGPDDEPARPPARPVLREGAPEQHLRLLTHCPA